MMNFRKLAASLTCAALMLSAQADNTKRNKRDRAEGSPTAGQQAENESDREITRKIRKRVVDDDTLSTYAKNVKIITREGQVTLRGPVNSEDENRKVEKAAIDVAGKANVSNQLEIVKKEKE